MPVQVVACVVLPSIEALLFDSFPVWKVFSALLFLHMWHYFFSYFNEADKQEDSV